METCYNYNSIVNRSSLFNNTKVTNMRTEYVVVICRDSSGMPTAPVYKIEVTEEQYELGYHYDSAMTEAIEEGYEATMLSHCFDNSEHSELFNTVAFLRLKRKTGEIQ